MTRGFDRRHSRRYHAGRLGLGAEDRRDEDVLWTDDRFGRRRDANPVVFDAQSRRVAMFHVLLRALDGRHEHQRQGDRHDCHAQRAADGG